MPPRADAAGVSGLARSTLVERARARIGAFAELSKFGIVVLVLVSAGAGFMLSAPLGADFPWMHGLIVLLGVMLLSSGASALNQVQERDRDALMARTANRPLPSGRLAHAHALAFAALAMVAGGGRLTDAGAIVLFGILFLWQMPHFWALALRYRSDYASGGFPMVSEVVGVEGTARLILLYASGLTAWSLAAPTFGVGGPISLGVAAVLGGRLMWLAIKFARHPEDQRGWLSLFLFSNFYLLLLFAGMVAERLIWRLVS